MNNSSNHKNCLVLNSDYRPIGIVDWKKAIIWSFKKDSSKFNVNIEILDYYENDSILGIGQTFKLPAVIKIMHYLKVYKKLVNFSRNNLFIRDNYTCQYCGCQFCINQLTYDHIIPKSRFKSNYKKCTNWSNITTSCKKCNAKKADRTPEEAGMQLKRTPYQPRYSEKYLRWHQELLSIYKETPKEWKPFLLKNEQYEK